LTLLWRVLSRQHSPGPSLAAPWGGAGLQAANFAAALNALLLPLSIAACSIYMFVVGLTALVWGPASDK
jgi:hypothetical protein